MNSGIKTYRNYGIDLLKIISTVLILFHHYQQVTGAYFSSINFFQGKFYFGYIVELFFVISGYVVYPYIRMIYKDEIDLKLFYWKKFKRFFPMVAFGAIVYEILLYIYVYILHNNWFDIYPTLWGTILDIFLIQSGWSFTNPCVNNPTWYISVLMLCYVIFYLLTKYAKEKKINEIYLYLFIMFIGISINTYRIELPFFNSNTCRGYYAFFWGLILRKLMPIIHKKTIEHKVISAILYVIIVIGIPLLIYGDSIWVADSIVYIMTYMYYSTLICITETTIVKKVCRASIIGELAKISFNVYILHIPCILFLCIYLNIQNIPVEMLHSYKAMFIYTLVSFAIGTMTYYLYDKPIKKYIDVGK